MLGERIGEDLSEQARPRELTRLDRFDRADAFAPAHPALDALFGIDPGFFFEMNSPHWAERDALATTDAEILVDEAMGRYRGLSS